MAIKSKLIVNQTHSVHVSSIGLLVIACDETGDEYTVDTNDVPDLLKAIQMVMDEHTGSSEPNKK